MAMNRFPDAPVSLELKTFVRWAISSVISAVFMMAWVLLQWGVARVVDFFKLEGINQVQLTTFQVGFAIATLAPVLRWIIVDVYRMGYGTVQDVRAIRSAAPEEQLE